MQLHVACRIVLEQLYTHNQDITVLYRVTSIAQSVDVEKTGKAKHTSIVPLCSTVITHFVRSVNVEKTGKASIQDFFLSTTQNGRSMRANLGCSRMVNLPYLDPQREKWTPRCRQGRPVAVVFGHYSSCLSKYLRTFHYPFSLLRWTPDAQLDNTISGDGYSY